MKKIKEYNCIELDEKELKAINGGGLIADFFRLLGEAAVKSVRGSRNINGGKYSGSWNY